VVIRKAAPTEVAPQAKQIPVQATKPKIT
jgi:hypothetical protein